MNHALSEQGGPGVNPRPGQSWTACASGLVPGPRQPQGEI